MKNKAEQLSVCGHVQFCIYNGRKRSVFEIDFVSRKKRKVNIVPNVSLAVFAIVWRVVPSVLHPCLHGACAGGVDAGALTAQTRPFAAAPGSASVRHFRTPNMLHLRTRRKNRPRLRKGLRARIRLEIKKINYITFPLTRHTTVLKMFRRLYKSNELGEKGKSTMFAFP